jgi:hypothetical protein
MNTASDTTVAAEPSPAFAHDTVASDSKPRRRPRDLSEAKVLDWADGYCAIHDEWPRWDSGPIPGTRHETWFSVSAAIALGQRGFPPGGSLAGFLAQHARVRFNAEDQNLTAGQIIVWAKAWQRRTGRWPRTRSGEIPGQGNLTWHEVDKLLRSGIAGRPAGTTLALLRIDECKPAGQTPLTEQQIFGWIDAHYNRTGHWPDPTSGRVHGAPGETWLGISLALVRGSRGLDGPSSLNELKKKQRAIRRAAGTPSLSIPQILAWADAHYMRTGKLPTHCSGSIREAPGESWKKVECALVNGTRGVPAVSSLARLFIAERGPNYRPDLTIAQILAWASAFHARTGRWPRQTDGPILEAPGESWSGLHYALQTGNRGLPRYRSLARLVKPSLAKAESANLNLAIGKVHPAEAGRASYLRQV